MRHMIEAKIVSDNAYDSFDIKATWIYIHNNPLQTKMKWYAQLKYILWMNDLIRVLLGDFCIEIGWGLADGSSTRYIEICFKHNI